MPNNNVKVPEAFREKVSGAGEAGMGYQIAVITLKNGRKLGALIFNEEWIGNVEGHIKAGIIPFEAADIADIEVTNKRWWKGFP